MGVQSSVYDVDGSTRTFPSTKHIATKQHCVVMLKRVLDNIWEVVEPELYSLINNSIIFIDAPLSYLYSHIEVRVADNADELADSPTDISAVAANIEELAILADNIDGLMSLLNSAYVTNGLPTTASCGDLAVDTLTGGIYEWKCPANVWELVAQSAGTSGTGTSTPPFTTVSGLPSIGTNGEILFNTSDGYFSKPGFNSM